MPDLNPSSLPHKKPWAITFFGILTIAGLIAMPFLAGPPDPEKMPDLVRFIGRFHPVLLHLPIGVFALIVFQELAAMLGRRRDPVPQASLLPLFFGAASAIVAVIAGFLLYQGGDEFAGSALVERHLWGGLIFAVAAVATFLVKAWMVSRAGSPAFFRVLLFGSVGVMGFASHDGASITHGENYLTEFAPPPVRKVLGLKGKDPDVKKPGAAPVDAPVAQSVYAGVVAPILEQRCVQCHKEGKSKGKFRMDTYELLVKGGKEEPGLVPGKSAESNIIIRMELPEDDEEHMPPEGKPDIEDPEVAIVKWWIDNGADPTKTLADYVIPAPIQDAISKLVPKAADAVADGTSHPVPAGPDDALKSAVAALAKDFPGAVTFESQQSALITFTAVSMRGNLDDVAFKKLKPVISQFVTVDLSATKVTDQTVAQLVSAKNLRLVRLAETGITDASIESLLKIPSLESINLYGTKVTDAGVSKLSAMPNLRRLYLWQTAVTPGAIKILREKLPKCEIVAGIEA
jgi:uncharacterized membrane protein